MNLLAQETPPFEKFYIAADPEITDTTRAILTQYSGIPEGDIVKHVQTIRDKAWQIYKYPCIGQYTFLNFSISTLPQYPTVLARLKTGNETLLDLGCCFGQDIRQLVFDGAPAASVSGSELEAGFVELGYELFNDKASLRSPFTTGDFLAPSMASLAPRSFDIVHAGAFFHIFSWAEQVEAVTRSLRLLKPRAGSVLFGRHTGVQVPGVVRHPATRSGEVWRHDLESWRAMMEEVRRALLGEVEFESEVAWKGEGNRRVQGYEWTRMEFCVTLK